MTRWELFIRRKLRSPNVQYGAIVALKVGLAVSIGTLLSLIPRYASFWYSPVSLADQCIFTVLGGADLTVGGATEQLFWRLAVGASAGAAAFALIQALGGSPVLQGVVFGGTVLLFTLVRARLPRADIGLTFATLACVYAVDGSYRDGNPFGVNGEALRDLLRSWAFGAAISLSVNFLVLPVKASRRAQRHMADSVRTIRDIVGFLLAEQVHEHHQHDAASVRKRLQADGQKLSALHAEMAWEVGWSASTLSQRDEQLEALLAIQRDLGLRTIDGPFVVDLPEDLVRIVRPAVALFVDWALQTLDSIVMMLDHRRPEIEAAQRGDLVAAQASLDNAHTQITLVVIHDLGLPTPDPDRLESLDRATHCLDATRTLIAGIQELNTLVQQASARPHAIQPYIFSTLFRKLQSCKRRRQLLPANPLRKGWSSYSYVPPKPISDRLYDYLTHADVKYAFKVALALSCLLAVLWSPASRPFFLKYTVRGATVPLLLALMPTTGLGVISWIGQLSGAVVGILYATLIMVIWRGVAAQTYNVPGLVVFELFLCLGVGWRMTAGPDFFAVTAMNGCAIFINVQWQLTRLGVAQSLPLHMGYMLSSSALAIALAIPFQLLVFPQPARIILRKSTAATLRTLASLALDQVALSATVLLTDDASGITVQSRDLLRTVAKVKADLCRQDSLVDMALMEWGGRDGFDPRRARAILEALHRCTDVITAHLRLCAPGPVRPAIRALMRETNEAAALGFANACSSVFWTLGAAWTILESPPAPLPAVDEAGERLLREMTQPDGGQGALDLLRQATHTHGGLGGEGLAADDVKRWWSLTLTLVTQRREIGRLIRIMGADWHHAAASTHTETIEVKSGTSVHVTPSDSERREQLPTLTM